MNTQQNKLVEISIDSIDRNPENPRLYFRQQELDELTESIRKFGVQVPIAVYKEDNRYVIIDGERRWRCSLKLNKKTIPAIVQNKPDPYNNLVLMFNIHALREQWDLMTMSLKLPRVIELYEKRNGKKPNEIELSEETGLTRSVIRRCRLLMSLPEHHIDIIKAELKKPKALQKISEDFYIEMERALTTISRAMPNIIPDDEKREEVRQVILEKYKNNTIRNIVDLRKLAKVARAENVQADAEIASKELTKVFSWNEYTIDEAYNNSVSSAYTGRDIITSLQGIINELDHIEDIETYPLDENILDLIKKLNDLTQKLLRGIS